MGQISSVNWLGHFLHIAGIKPAELARSLNTSRQNVTRIMKLKSLPREWAEQIAPLLKLSSIELMYGPGTTAGSAIISEQETISVPVEGEAGAGLWREADWEGNGHPPVPVVPGRYPAKYQKAWRIVGPSANLLRIEDGDYVIGVPFEVARSVPRTDDIVIVERRRDGLVETTCKQVVVTDDAIELWPRSTDSRFREPYRIPRKELVEDNKTYSIVAVVIGRYSPIG